MTSVTHADLSPTTSPTPTPTSTTTPTPAPTSTKTSTSTKTPTPTPTSTKTPTPTSTQTPTPTTTASNSTYSTDYASMSPDASISPDASSSEVMPTTSVYHPVTTPKPPTPKVDYQVRDSDNKTVCIDLKGSIKFIVTYKQDPANNTVSIYKICFLLS